jgi:hypothetical protein
VAKKNTCIEFNEKSQKFRCDWIEEVTRIADPNAQKKEVVGELYY